MVLYLGDFQSGEPAGPAAKESDKLDKTVPPQTTKVAPMTLFLGTNSKKRMLNVAQLLQEVLRNHMLGLCFPTNGERAHSGIQSPTASLFRVREKVRDV